MKTKICPCCDQPIKGIYCKGCRKIVLNPVEQNITYYLNTRHPEHETDCSYHNDVPQGSSRAAQRYSGSGNETVKSANQRMTASEMEAKKAQIRERMTAGKQERRSASHPMALNGDVVRKPDLAGKSAAGSSSAKKIIIGIVIYLIVVFGGVIGMLIGNIADMFEDLAMEIRVSEAAEEFYEEARWKNEDALKEMGYVMLNGLEVTCYVPDEKVQDFFSMSIYAPGYMSSAEE